jgi:hypothetical protein
MNLDELAKQYGGTAVSSTNLDELAKRYGGVSNTPVIDENAKSAPFSLKNLAIGVGSGGLGGIKALTDLFGATNTASEKLGEAQQAAQAMKTPERQAEMARREAIKERAKGNTWEEIKAGFGGFTEAPLEKTSEFFGSSLPVIAATMLAPAAAVPAGLARLGMTGRAINAARSPAAGVSAGMSLGGQKGQDYETVKQEALKQGKSPEEAESLAQAASEYSLQNAPRQLASTALGVLTGVLGVEPLLGKLGKAVPKADVSKGVKAPTYSEAILKNIAGESAPEFLQAATAQLGSNQALNQAGMPTDMMSGVLASAISDALAGGTLGAATSPLKMSALRKNYAEDQLAKERAVEAKFEAGIKAEEEKLAQTKETFKQTDLLGLPAPAKEIAPSIDEPVLVNPLGNITPDELGPEVTKYVNKYRKDNGMPNLQSYSIEDIKDAMTAVNPEGEQGALDAILTAKTGYSGTEKYTPEDVTNAALEKNIASDTKGFNDFLSRTTGNPDLTTMSPPQLFSAFKALKDMPANETGAQIVLPEGTNASRFKPAQYKKAIDYVGLTFDEMGGTPLSIDTIVKDIQESTGLETERDARALLDTAIKNNDLAENREVVFRTTKPDTGELVSTFRDKDRAEAAAKKQGLNLQETTLVTVKPAVKEETTKPRAVLPEGYDIAETAFVEGEKPAAFTITPEGRAKPLATVIEENDVPAKLERLQGLRRTQAYNDLQAATEHQTRVERGRTRLEEMEARGEVDTEGYKKAQARQVTAERILNQRIDSLLASFDEYSAPLQAKPVGKKTITRKGFTVSKQGQKSGTFPTREAAEESILADLPDEALGALVSDPNLGGFKARAVAEQNRRRSPQTKGKKVSEVLKGMEPKPQTQEAIQKTAELRAKLDKMGLQDVGLKIVEAIEAKADGSYEAKLIQIALDSKHPIRTMRHEAMHALKELGFFTPQQWASLEKMARSKWVDQYLKSKNAYLPDGKMVTRYEAYTLSKDQGGQGLTESEVLEEAIADAFGDFDVNKAPSGMLTALLNKMRNFFEALNNYLAGRGFESYQDVFGKIEKGELKATEAEGPSQENAWKATPEDQEKAEKYSLKNGILPYVSEGRLDLPMMIKPKFSLKTADKYGIDPVIGIPLNKDGTVTVYYHTTKDLAVKLNASKIIPSGGRSRIYLTNESNGGKIINKPGSFDQEFDGSTVLLNIDPSLLQVDDEYEDGRKDFFVPLAQGDFFNRKMNLASIQKSRKEGIVETFSDVDMAQRMETALAEYNNLSAAEQKVRLKQARTLLKREHNIGTLLSENGKLEKTRVGDYGLKQEDKSVASMGLGLASAQQITDKLSTCPQSAICEGLCLGETSGGNFLYGGAASEDTRSGIEKSAFRAGPRMMQYLKTEALVVHPEEFALVLNYEISMFEKWSEKETERKKNADTGKMEVSEKEIYQPAIRLNVTSDFRPRMWLPIIEAHPDTNFYDYTKLNGNPVAPNHHLTYSSTGFGQFVDGEKVLHKTNNWNAMRGRMDRGDNVAMAFSSKSALPDFVVDEETGTKYQVWDGDNYDARFLDPKPGEEGNLLNRGMIVGLRNKASTLKEKTATKDTDGFFVDYDPKRDDKTVTVPNQSQFGFKMTSPEGKKVIPIAKYSLRAAPDTPEFKRFFGDSKVVDANGEPKVMYHGTGQDILAFRGKQADAIFLTDDPSFAEKFSKDSAAWMSAHPEETLSKAELAQGVKDAIAAIRKDYKTRPEGKVMIDSLKAGTYADATAEAQEYLRNAYKQMMPSGPNILPVYVSAQNPFDYQNPDHVEKLIKRYKSNNDSQYVPLGGGNMGKVESLVTLIKKGSWEAIETDDIQEAIQSLKFDGFYVQEDGRKNLAVYNPTQIKSATGNIGTYDVNNPDIRYSLRNIGDEIRSMPNGKDIYGSMKGTTTTRDEKGFIERMMDAISPESRSSIRQKALNRYNQLSVYDRELVKKMGGAALLADASAEAGALQSDLAAGVTAAALGVHNRKGGIPVFKNGITTVDTSVKGPTEIFSPLAAMGDPEAYQAYQFWAGAKRGSRFLADGKEKVFTPAMVNYAKQLCDVDAKGNVTGKYPEFAKIQKEWTEYNNGLVQYMVDTGVLSKEKANEFTKHGDYIPFYRQLDGEKTVGPNIFQSISGVKPPKAIKHGEAPLADFLETVVRNTQAAIQSGMKNTAAQRAVDVAVQIKQAKQLPEQSSAPDTVTVLRGGKPVSYQTADPLFIEAVKSLNLPELPFLSILSGPANLLRNLVTKDPGFMLANLMRDSMSAYVTSGANMLPVVDTVKNFGRAIQGTDPAYEALLNAGLLGGYEFSQSIEASGEALAKDLRKKTGTQTGFEKATKPFTSLWAALEKGTEASDAATRMAVYKDTLARTNNEAEALFRALEVMNFNRKGSSAVVRILTAGIPFLNARMQGLDVFYRAAFGRMGNADAKAIQKSFFVRGATLASLSVMYWALTHDDEDYKKQEQETKDNNWLFPSLGIRIPIPFEVGVLFKVLPERLAALAFGSDTGKDFAKSMGRALTSTFGVQPFQVALPLLEAKTNYSFYTGRPIISQGLEGVAPEYQVGANTSPIFGWLGKELGASPMMLEHIYKGYMGSMGMYLVDLMDAIGVVNDNSPKAAKRFEQMPIIKRFAIDKEARGTVTSYYELKKEVDTAVRTFNFLERAGQGEDLAEYTRENAKMLMTRDFISSMDKDIKEINEMAMAVRNSPMSPEAKRDALTALNRASNAMTAKIQNVRKAVE